MHSKSGASVVRTLLLAAILAALVGLSVSTAFGQTSPKVDQPGPAVLGPAPSKAVGPISTDLGPTPPKALDPSSTDLGQTGPKVVEVAVSGNQNINAETIRNAISLKVGDNYTEAATAKDQASIMSLGYFSAVTIHKDEVAGGEKITYEVTENPRITSIKIIGNGPIPVDKILAIMKTKSGQVANQTTFNQDVEAIQAHFGEQGYVAYITEDAGVDPKTGVLTVPILVATVESVEVTGNKKTRSYVFLREMKTKPGTVFNMKTLKDDIMRIYNLDILETVKEPQTNPGKVEGQIKIVLPVVEKKTGQVSLGVGYSSQQRLVGQMKLSETNLRGTGEGMHLTWEQGTSQAVGGSGSYEAGFFNPWIDNKHTSLSVNAFDKILYRFSSGIFGSTTFSNDETYNERHEGGDVTLSRPLTDQTRVFLGSKFEHVNTDPSLFNLDSTGSSTGFTDLSKIAQKGNVTSGSLRLVNNTRDVEMDPASGGYNGISLEIGSTNAVRFTPSAIITSPPSYDEIPFSGGFEKTSIDVRRYFSKGGRKLKPDDKRTTLALRLLGGYASGTIPFFEQFFVGGAESLRGYREDRFWGNKELLASVELRKPIAHAISGVLFVDYGDAWGASTDFNITELPQHDGFRGNFGVGLGIRVSTPVGNLRLDYGVGNEGGRTHFSMGQAF